MDNMIKIFDTTLRDGEQAPGCSMNEEEKLKVALKLEKLGVNIIEAGFPIASEGDFNSVKLISENVKDCEIAGLSRANLKDIDRAWEAIKNAANPRIHTFIATSDIHLKYKLKKSTEQSMTGSYTIFETDSLEQTIYFDSDVNPLINQYYRIIVKDTLGYKTYGDVSASPLDAAPFAVGIDSFSYGLQDTALKITLYWSESLDNDFKHYTVLNSNLIL